MRVDLVVEQVDAVRQRAAHREEVDQPAAHAVLAGRDHLAHVAVAGERELGAQRVGVEPRALLDEERVAGEERRRREALQRGGRRHDARRRSRRCVIRQSVASRSETRSWCGEKLS